MKVTELEGTQLDYWVARAEGYEFIDIPPDVDGKNACRVLAHPGLKASGWVPAPRGHYGHMLKRWSSDWWDGGPIIERERIMARPCGGGVWDATPCNADAIEVWRWNMRGPTPLIAAMRAYVVSKFGEEVPDSAN